MKLTAQQGGGDALAAQLLEVADALRSTPGCELYVINRSPSEPDTVWVTELWASQEAVDSSLKMLESDEGRARLERMTALLAGPPERIDLEPLGGVGYLASGSGATIANLGEVEDLAPRFGLREVGEARFATVALDARRTGVSLQRLRPGMRQAFGHRHHHAEEVYVVLSGGGKVKLDDDIRELRTLDALRVAPGSARAFEAGPEGLDLLAVGPRHAGDAEMLRDFWPA